MCDDGDDEMEVEVHLEGNMMLIYVECKVFESTVLGG